MSFILQKIDALKSTVPVEYFTRKALLAEQPYADAEQFIAVLDFVNAAKAIRDKIATELKADPNQDLTDFKMSDPDLWVNFYPHARTYLLDIVPTSDAEPAPCVIYTRLKCPASVWDAVAKSTEMTAYVAAATVAAPILGWEFSEHRITEDQPETYEDVVAAFDAATAV